MDACQDYLRLVGSYCDELGGLHWSAVEDALAYDNGETFAFADEIALFLEGFAQVRPLVHFAFILHLLDLIRGPRPTLSPEVRRLRQAFQDAGRPTRNAGVLAAVLSREALDWPQPISVGSVCERLRNRDMPIRWFLATFNATFYPAQQPPLDPLAFKNLVLRAAQRYSLEELRTWFRTGRGPVKEAAESILQVLPTPAPRTLAGALAELLERPRLAGARPYVSQLVSALALPAPRLGQQELPVGGYADVTTHGHPDRILPSQFALDEWDFFRRCAENELLYFRREEPHAQVRRELVVLLDQGVRTWGDVRLVLSAAVLAFAKQALARKLRFSVATTTTEGDLLDPEFHDPTALCEVVESSDLSLHPGLALEHVLEQPAELPRDVVLLTHTRSLGEQDVRAAARRTNGQTRLFAVTLDASEMVSLAELRHGSPVEVRSVWLRPSELAVAPDSVPEPIPERSSGWEGDVEPIGFPFRFGTTHNHFQHFEFDDAGEWLIGVHGRGLLHVWRTNGEETEVLPRPMWQGHLFGDVERVLGVVGGFVLVGRRGERFLVAHYDMGQRRCTVHSPGAVGGRNWEWTYSRKYHTVVARSPGDGLHCMLDLNTGVCFSSQEVAAVPEARDALGEGPTRSGKRKVTIVRSRSTFPPPLPSLLFDEKAGGLELLLGAARWSPFLPRADGRALFAGAELQSAEFAGDCLLLVARVRKGRRLQDSRDFYLFRGPPGVLVTQFNGYAWGAHRLSPDGRKLCFLRNGHLAVFDTAQPSTPLFQTKKGLYSHRVEFVLGSRWLRLRTGNHHFFLLEWERGSLTVERARHDLLAKVQARGCLPECATATGVKDGVPTVAQYDLKRFILGAESNLRVVADVFGQVALFDRQGQLICMFFAFRDQFAAWMPDGTRYGPAWRTGGPATPGALERIGQALNAACLRGGGAV